jgi:hypothetical protein
MDNITDNNYKALLTQAFSTHQVLITEVQHTPLLKLQFNIMFHQNISTQQKKLSLEEQLPSHHHHHHMLATHNHGMKDNKTRKLHGQNKPLLLKNGKKPSTKHKMSKKPIMLMKSMSNITDNGMFKPEINTVLVHAETSGINLHSHSMMPKVQQENGI